MSKEEIEKAKQDIKNSYVMSTKHCLDNENKQLKQSIETLLQYINQLEQENVALKKGQNSLMASRKKWRYRYYKEKRKSNQQSKIIDEMGEYLAIIRDCPNEDKGSNLDCENRCSNDDSLYVECWKQYFEKKVEGK